MAMNASSEEEERSLINSRLCTLSNQKNLKLNTDPEPRWGCAPGRRLSPAAAGRGRSLDAGRSSPCCAARALRAAGWGSCSTEARAWAR